MLAGLLVAKSLIHLWESEYILRNDKTVFARLAGGVVVIYIVLHIIRFGVVFAFWVRGCVGVSVVVCVGVCVGGWVLACVFIMVSACFCF